MPCAVAPSRLRPVTSPVTPTRYPARVWQNITQAPAQFAKDLKDSDWVGFPGGELEGKRPKALCPACRDGPSAPGRRATGPTPSCPLFPMLPRRNRPRSRPQGGGPAGHRVGGAVPDRAAVRAGQPAAARDAEGGAIDRARLDARNEFGQVCRPQASGADRRAPRAAADRSGPRRQQCVEADAPGNDVREREMAAAIHAAELQLPESWLPFVVSR